MGYSKLKKISLCVVTSLVLSSGAGHLWASDLAVTNIWSPGDTLNAADLNQNFSDTEIAVTDNHSLITRMFSGDGSAGDLTVSAATNWNSTPPTNPYFNNITINAAQTLTVPAGTIIRCTGSFTNNGTLVVSPGAEADGVWSVSNGPTMGITSVSHPGDTPGTATMGMYHTNAVADPKSLVGGVGGKAIPQSVAITSFGSFKIGGGSGAGYDNQGNQGGGLVKIYCEGPIVNNGTIDARGENATNTSIGGGGGGIVILASRTSVDNSGGTINVSGGNASTFDGSFGGNGGGGGGGIIVMASPTSPVLGTELVAGGTGEAGTNTVTATSRFSGAGGGGSGGAGGNGGNVDSAGAKSAAVNGGAGYTIDLTIDPISIAR